MLPAVRAALRDYDPLMLVRSTTTMDAAIGRTTAGERFRATLSAVFAAAALFLGAVGVYGMLTRTVADRRREIGVRIALGARPRQVQRLVVRETVLSVGLGLIIGIPAAIGAALLLRSLVFEISPTTPSVFVFSAALLVTSATLASALPARRAAKLDPMTILRE